MSSKPARTQELGLFAQRLYIEFSILFYFLTTEGLLLLLFPPPRHTCLGFFSPLPSAPPHSSRPTMARMNRPAPVEVCYKNMRFLITHNPTNATLNTFLEVRRGGWKGETMAQLRILGLKAGVVMQQGSVLCKMRQQNVPFGTTAPCGIPGRWVQSLLAFQDGMFWRTPSVVEMEQNCLISLASSSTSTLHQGALQQCTGMHMQPPLHLLNKDFSSQISRSLSNACRVLGDTQGAGGLGVV